MYLTNNETVNCRYPAGVRIQELLDQARAGEFPAEGNSLLKEGRRLRQAADSRELWLHLPFSMMCETLYGGKEGYQEIIKEFDKIRSRDLDRMIREACAGEAEGNRELAWFLAACADTLEFTSAEIYEHYRYLADLIRTTVRILTEECWNNGGMEGIEPETAEIYGYSVLKGCRMKVLLREKYEGLGQGLLVRGGCSPDGESRAV